MKKILIIATLATLLLFSCNNNKKAQDTNTDSTEQTQSAKDTITEIKLAPSKALLFDPATLSEEPMFQINTNLGTIIISLYKDTPKHRDNFVKLASERFFDSVLFHRVINGFMIQTGDPLTKNKANEAMFGSGGPGYNIPAEILPQFTHKKGALAAARMPDISNPKRESSGSQFYLVQNEEACKQLDGDYTIFGETLDGLEVIDRIARIPTKNERPIKDIYILSILPL